MLSVLVIVLIYGLLPNFVLNEWLDDCLEAHNEIRAKEKKPLMRINQTLCVWARKRAKELKDHCRFDHSGNKNSGYGENLGAGLRDCKQTVTGWIHEKDKFQNSRSAATPSHYTQIVWRNTLHLCCVLEEDYCKYKYLTVCTYWKPGNIMSAAQFRSNV